MTVAVIGAFVLLMVLSINLSATNSINAEAFVADVPNLSTWNPIVPPGIPRLATWNPIVPPGIPHVKTWNPIVPPGIPRLATWNPIVPPGIPR